MTTADPGWEEYLRSKFPAYLLPESVPASLRADEAARFLEKLSGRAGSLDLIRAASFLAPRAAALGVLVQELIDELVTRLPSTTRTCVREWEGAYQGRLHVRDTIVRRLQGRPSAFVTLDHERVFDLPENIVVRALCERLLELLVHLRECDVLREDVGWGESLRGTEGVLRRIIASTRLRDVPLRETSAYDVAAARGARHAAYHEAADWTDELRAALADDRPQHVAELIARGALLPLSDATRFELAVLIRLAEQLEREFASRQPAQWRAERAAIRARRDDVFAFVRDDGFTVRVFYNCSVLPAGPADLGGRHYLSNRGRLRPDLTITVEHGSNRVGAIVIECKHSSDVRTLVAGYHEALLYRWEYAEHLPGRVKAMLVASGGVAGAVRSEDEVAAVTWAAWPPQNLVAQVLEFVGLAL